MMTVSHVDLTRRRDGRCSILGTAFMTDTSREYVDHSRRKITAKLRNRLVCIMALVMDFDHRPLLFKAETAPGAALARYSNNGPDYPSARKR